MFHKSNHFLRNSNHTAQFALSNGDLPHKKQKRPKSLSTRLSEKKLSRRPASPKNVLAPPRTQKSKSDPIVGSLEPDWFRA